MSNYEHGTFTFLQNTTEKRVDLSRSYDNQIVIKVTPINKNINIYLKDVQNNYFTIEKNSNEEVDVSYIVIESDS